MPRTAPHMPMKLAQAAFEKFADDGINNVNLDQIALQAGVTKGSIYCHYKSKRDLLLAACAYYYRKYKKKVHNSIAHISDPIERLRKILELSVHNCVIDPKNRVFTTEIFALSLQYEDVKASWAQFYDTVIDSCNFIAKQLKVFGSGCHFHPFGGVNDFCKVLEDKGKIMKLSEQRVWKIFFY